MPNRLSKVPVATYVPAVRPVQGRAAYCTTQKVLVGYTSLSGGSLFGSSPAPSGTKLTYLPPDPTDPTSGGAWVPSSLLSGQYDGVSQPIGGGSVASKLQPQYRDVTTCYPAVNAVAGSPARIDYSAQTGWNAGARSRAPVPSFGAFSGQVVASLVATQLGLADAFFDHTYGYMTHSIVARPGEWAVVERGITKATGSLPAEARLEVRRLGGKVVYLANGNELYTSTSLTLGEVYGAVLLYSLSDAVDDPVIASLAQVAYFQGALPMWRIAAADTASLSFMDAKAPVWQLAAQLSRVRGVMSLDATLPAIEMIGGDRQLAYLKRTLPMARLEARLGRKERVVSQLSAMLPPLVPSMTLVSGGSMRLDYALPMALIAAAPRPYAFLNAELPFRLRLTTTEPYMPNGEIDGMDAMFGFDAASLDSALLLLAMDSLGVSTEASLVIVVDLVGMDSLALSDSATLGQLVEMLAMERVAVGSSTSTVQREALQYAVNLATGGVATLDGLGFDGFAQSAGTTYAWRSDGLYRLGARTDAGELISALVDFGTTDFGTSAVKRLDTAYLGVRTDGQVFVRVVADDGRERIYRAAGQANVRRSNLGKGVAGRYWNLKLELVDASFCEVDSIELSVGATIRRGFGLRG